MEYTNKKEVAMSEHKGKCFCGAVEFSVSGEPVAMGFCHCESCRHWSAGPVNAFTLWKPDALKITKGEGNIGTYNKTANSFRKWCKTCGGPVHGSSTDESRRHIRGDAANPRLQACCARVLWREGAEHQGRIAEDEGLPEGDGRFRDHTVGVSAARGQ
jgi:hypothetical protein